MKTNTLSLANIPSYISSRRWITGPRNDPYEVVETTLHLQNGAYAILRQGFTDKVIFRFRRGRREWELPLNTHAEVEKANAMLVQAVGLTKQQIKRVKRKLEQVEYRLHKAHGGYEWKDGFPGEQVCRCKCGAFIDYNFNPAAVE